MCKITKRELKSLITKLVRAARDEVIAQNVYLNNMPTTTRSERYYKTASKTIELQDKVNEVIDKLKFK